MILSHYKRLIFIHIYKTAGTSITNALLPYALSPMQKKLNRFAKKLLISRPFDSQPYEDHIETSQLIERMGKSAFNRFFSFACVRNPWGWQVSLYKYARRFQNDPYQWPAALHESFYDYINWRCTEDVRFQKDFVCSENGSRLLSFLGRFENLENDFKKVCDQINISVELPRLNVSNTGSCREF